MKKFKWFYDFFRLCDNGIYESIVKAIKIIHGNSVYLKKGKMCKL